MKKLLAASFLIIFATGLFFVVKKFPSFVKADTGAPVTITATYNSSTGQLNASGTYAWEECEPGEETNILGYALFINGGTPAINDSNALDRSGMHLANSGNPCTKTPDNWEDNSHVLSSAPINVCVVVYDVRADDSADPGGVHSLIGAGGDYNTDNSWDLNGNSYSEESCTTPEVITATPTPTPFVAPTEGGGVGGGPVGAPVCTDTTPSAPTLLRVASAGADSIKVTWNKVTGVSHYSIFYGPSTGNYPYSVVDTGDTDNFVINGVSGGCFAVKAVNGCMPGPLSNEICTGGTGGQVLGASTLGSTGVFGEEVVSVGYFIGFIFTALGVIKYAPKKAKR